MTTFPIDVRVEVGIRGAAEWKAALVTKNTFLAVPQEPGIPLRRQSSEPAISYTSSCGSEGYSSSSRYTSTTGLSESENEPTAEGLPLSFIKARHMLGDASFSDDDAPSDAETHQPAPQQVWKPVFSAGAVNHGTGRCKPCAWTWKPRGCYLGQECPQCHMCNVDDYKQYRKDRLAGLKANRKKKKEARRLTKRVEGEVAAQTQAITFGNQAMYRPMPPPKFQL